MLGSATVELVRALIASAAEHKDGRSALAESLFTRITTYIRLHLSEADLGPARIAAEHNISLRYLHTLFARQGLHVHEWVIRERLEGARRVLASSSAQEPTIAAVGRALGFSDPGHFARRFRAAYGLSPSEWQRLHRKPEPAGNGPVIVPASPACGAPPRHYEACSSRPYFTADLVRRSPV
jgi:AraC-like DNA-binding protein